MFQIKITIVAKQSKIPSDHDSFDLAGELTQALHEAVSNLETTKALRLLRQGASMDKTNRNGRLPIEIYIWYYIHSYMLCYMMWRLFRRICSL